jgi:two-component system sensor histidine kinase CpxA
LNVRSVTAKILIWSLSTLVLSLAAFSWISTSAADRARREAFARSDAFELYQAISAYEGGGHSELARYFAALNGFEGPGRYLTDSSGRDLLTGEDRSALLEGSQGLRRSFMNIGNKLVVRVASPDWRYRYVIVNLTQYGFASFAPYYFLLLAVVAVLFWFLAMHFAWPLRRLAAAVRRFGGGDLTARVGMHRRDEIGEVGRSFDNMAARIQTLLTASQRWSGPLAQRL